ncbi:NAF/FISL domain [Sesbania bispinosa]|nr:NAF/FISL domain [Sesbania bispinosa]
MRPIAIAFSMKEDNINIDFNKDGDGGEEGEVPDMVGAMAKPARPFYNAFEIISSLSHGFELRSLFETRESDPCLCSYPSFRLRRWWRSLGMVAKKLRFRITGKKEFMVRMQG